MQFAILSHFVVAFCYIAMGYSDDMRKKNQDIIAARIRRLRGEKTQNEVARKLHITQSYLSEIERGKKTPSKALLLDIAQTFDTTVSYLLGETDSIVLPASSEQMWRMHQSSFHLLADVDCIRIPIVSMSELVSACRTNSFSYERRSRIGVPKADIGRNFSASNLPFAVKLYGGNNKTFGYPEGSRAVINPEEAVKNFDIVLVFYKGELALKKIMNKDENEWDLVSYDGSKVHVSADEVVSGEFKMLGKLTSVTLTLNHGF